MTIAYANHRPETLPLSQALMQEHQAIILEEPPHPLFPQMLRGKVAVEDYLLDQDVEYPAFSQRQCEMLIHLFRTGKTLVQIEPYLELLIEVQDFFADGHGPEDLDRSTLRYQVYLREKEATRALLDYYQTVRGDQFEAIVESIKSFARADAQRFALRDRLRAREIARSIERNRPTCVEAGPMHLLLYHYLREFLSPDWSLKPVFTEVNGLQSLGLKSGLYGPGDKLTVHYLFNRSPPEEAVSLLCGRTLIFMKIVHKEELADQGSLFPHLQNETRAAALVNRLSLDQCRELFWKLRDLSEEAALEMVKGHLSSSR